MLGSHWNLSARWPSVGKMVPSKPKLDSSSEGVGES